MLSISREPIIAYGEMANIILAKKVPKEGK